MNYGSRKLGYGNIKCIGTASYALVLSEREQLHNERGSKRCAKCHPRRLRRAVWADTSKYTGEKLRQLRAERGVGQPAVLRNVQQFFREYGKSQVYRDAWDGAAKAARAA